MAKNRELFDPRLIQFMTSSEVGPDYVPQELDPIEQQAMLEFEASLGDPNNCLFDINIGIGRIVNSEK